MLTDHIKTVDEFVEEEDSFLINKSSKEYYKTVYNYIVRTNRHALLRILKSETNVPSVHDLLIISEISKILKTKTAEYMLLEILEIYSNREDANENNRIQINR